jgi:glutamate-1-semialdehyde aminotransferase
MLPERVAVARERDANDLVFHRSAVNHQRPQTRFSMTTSRQLFEAAKKRIPGGVNSPVRAFRGVGGEPFFVKSASGCRLTTVDDRELIDFVGTWGPAILGHAAEPVIEAVRHVKTLKVSSVSLQCSLNIH